MTNSETIYRHKLSRSVYFDKIGWHKLSHRRPKNAKTDKLSVSESFFPLGILKCAFYFLEAFFHCQQYMIIVSINDWFLRGKFKGTSSGLGQNLIYVLFFLFFFFLKKLSWKFWVTSLYGNSVSLKGNSSNIELEFSQ